MRKKLLISDANILIDMDAGELLEPMFQLSYEFATPDILYDEELEEQHPHLIKMGLQKMSLSESSVMRVVELVQKYHKTGVSSNDLSTLALAEQEIAPLLTGDQKLRQVCVEEKREVHGTLWLVSEMVSETLVTVEQVEVAYQKMINDGSRLPLDLINTQLAEIKKKF